MKNFIMIVALALVSTACVSSAQFSALKAQNDMQRDQNEWLRQHPGDAASSDSTASPASPDVTVSDPGGTTSVMLAREPHGPYQGTIGAQDRHVMRGPKLKLQNHLCAKGSRDAWGYCTDRDDIGGDDYDFYIAVEIDGESVVQQSSQTSFNPDTGEVLLPPNMTGYIPLGESCSVDVTFKAYQDRGGVYKGVRVLDLSARPRTVTKTYNACDSTVTYQEITETFF